ncbi:WbqC-like protein family protein [Dyadobacter soli]|uniref:WbqC-like protein family protein n=1 Tax=Dyadobacter soli TaxID=659014 RepID=A0A1G7X8J0_9BACT|nr:WbqC family protein [Dyadobacter soli]SDG80481.1 WbqC-like protein family protein [Dyadobacter soli]
MTIAIMQPYIFPYIGYFQLINAVDKFIIYDDVNFINKGWINRNNLLVGGKAHLFTLPLKDASQNKLILEVELARHEQWQKKLLKTIQQSYQKAPGYQKVFELLEEIVNLEVDSINELCIYALKKTCAYMGIGTEIVPSSTIYNNKHLKGQDRILDICKQEQATHYINPIGGVELYDKGKFENEGIRLDFIKSISSPYPQFKNAFVPWLSVIDVLMFNDPNDIRKQLEAYELI